MVVAVAVIAASFWYGFYTRKFYSIPAYSVKSEIETVRLTQLQTMIELTDAQPSHLERLVALVHHRWTLSVLAELYRDDGAKFVTLVNRLSLSRDSLSRTLEHLKTLDLAIKNPGYGHPMRPEYVLTPKGQLLGSSALELVQTTRQLEITDTIFKKWSFPVLHALHRPLERFTDLLEAIPGITTRALSLALRDLEEEGSVRREENAYRLTERGVALAAKLESFMQALVGDAVNLSPPRFPG
jgi:DNA-binding HxlR family transcriptional regulator